MSDENTGKDDTIGEDDSSSKGPQLVLLTNTDAAVPSAPLDEDGSANTEGADDSVAGVLQPTLIRRQVHKLLDSRKFTDRKKLVMLQRFIWKTEEKCGSKWIRANKQAWLFDGIRLTPMRVTMKDTRWIDFICWKYGLVENEKITHSVTAALRSLTRYAAGYDMQLKRFSHFDQMEGALYLSCYNGKCFRLDGNSVSIVPNGTACIFLDDDGGVPIDIDLERDVQPSGMYDATIVDDVNFLAETDSMTTAAHQRDLFRIWSYFIAFADLAPTKPILVLTGQAGSGKTMSAKRVQTIATGQSMAIVVGQTMEKDFGVTLLRLTPTALLDNIDNEIPWLNDVIASYTTNGTFPRRVLYTDDETMLITPSTFLTISTRSPKLFSREDIADRLIPLRVARREENVGFISEHELLQNVSRNRRWTYGEWLYNLNQIVKTYNESENRFTGAVADRMADFYRMAMIIGLTLGYTESYLDQLLAALRAERKALKLEGSSIDGMLDIWLQADENAGRFMLLGQLFDELKKLAEERKLPFIKTPRTFFAKFKEAEPSLDGKLIVEKKPIKNNVFAYAFTRKF